MPDDPMITDEQPQGHRAGAWVVLLMGIAGLGLGVFHWQGLFAAAFAHEQSTFKTPDQIETDRIEGLKSKDTDHDGLSDYDEIYIYKTSPYLKDSDSDGYDDKTEVEHGSDPNCPAGKTCSALAIPPPPTAVTDSSTSTDAAPPVDASLQEQQALVDQLMNPTPDQIRAILLKAGMQQADLQKIDDQTLLDLYKQSLQEVQNQQSTTTSP
jgi:hypothetical protein